jgi:hypothetical protein
MLLLCDCFEILVEVVEEDFEELQQKEEHGARGCRWRLFLNYYRGGFLVAVHVGQSMDMYHLEG